MNSVFWQRLHGGSTHLPIVLLLASVLFDLISWRARDNSLRRGLRIAGLACAVVGVLGGFGAVISGLAMTRGQMLGTGFEKLHHLFVWPAFTLAVIFVGWRVVKRDRFTSPAFKIYLTSMTAASVLTLGAGFWGGEMLLNADSPSPAPTAAPVAISNQTAVSSGHQLFMMNCAHCHGETGAGDGPDEGADLRNLRKSDARISSIIHNGIKGEMPKFGEKFSPSEIQCLTAYIRSLH